MGVTTLVTFEEFEQMDFGADHVELLKGEIIRMPPAFDDHMDASETLFKKLDAAVERLRTSNPGLELGKVHMERGYLLSTKPRSWLQPDVSLTQPNQATQRYKLGAPLIVFEIVSEYDRAGDLEDKVSEYLAHGAAEVWLFYPKKRHARVFDLSGAARLETESIRTPLLPGIEIPFAGFLR